MTSLLPELIFYSQEIAFAGCFFEGEGLWVLC